MAMKYIPGSDDVVGQLAWYIRYAAELLNRAEKAEREVEEMRRHTESDQRYMRKLERDLRWAERRIEEGEL